jgi:hypothetical protein
MSNTIILGKKIKAYLLILTFTNGYKFTGFAKLYVYFLSALGVGIALLLRYLNDLGQHQRR